MALFALFASSAVAQSLIGAWEFEDTATSGKVLRGFVLFSEKYQVATWYDPETGVVVKTNGGLWSIDGDRVTEVVAFDSENNERVGSKITFAIEWANPQMMRIVGSDTWLTQIDKGASDELSGAWFLSGSKSNGEDDLQVRDNAFPGNTMKILSGSRFQWITYDAESKVFKGTGGGIFTTIDGQYTETVEFSSVDHSYADTSKQFQYELINGDWHNTGKSSKGLPIYEIWTRRAE